VCPSSNVRTGVVPAIRLHPLPRLVAAGLTVTVNTDDPAMFGVRLGEEFVDVATAFELERANITDLVRNAVSAAFLEPAAARTILDAIDECVASAGSVSYEVTTVS
jgi:aminodeoxyfutalosine deaminase